MSRIPSGLVTGVVLTGAVRRRWGERVCADRDRNDCALAVLAISSISPTTVIGDTLATALRERVKITAAAVIMSSIMVTTPQVEAAGTMAQVVVAHVDPSP